MQPNRKWRKKPTDELIHLMEETVELKLYLVQEKGPLSLSFKDEDGKKFDINIGNNISCSCGGGKFEHCIHTLFALNKVYKIPFNNPLILQLNFTDQELNKLMDRKNNSKKKKNNFNNNSNLNNNNNKDNNNKKSKKKSKKNSIQMSLIDDCVCPICQEDLYTHEGIYFCSNSCGHNFHIKCLKVFIKHKKDNNETEKCPMCRSNWNEEEFDKIISSNNNNNKCFKSHKNINCSNCQRMSIKFERFHCLNCDNYDLCYECFSEEIHKELNHKFIMKKHAEDKWFGIDYKNDFEEDEDEIDSKKNNNNNNNDICYVIKNIYLSQYLVSCLPDYNGEIIEKLKAEEEERKLCEPQEDPNDLRLRNIPLNNNNNNSNNIVCAYCKKEAKLNNNNYKINPNFKLKFIPDCHHVIHVKCAEKIFKFNSYEKHYTTMIVDKLWNKCRIDGKNIFKGLNSLKVVYEENNNNNNNKKAISSKIVNNNINNNNNNNINPFLQINNIRKVMTREGMINKKQIINKILLEDNLDKYNNNNSDFGFGLNIQKLNFNREADIHRYENEMINKQIFNEKIKNKGLYGKIPYKQIHTKVKKSDTITAKNKITDNNNINNILEVRSNVVNKENDKKRTKSSNNKIKNENNNNNNIKNTIMFNARPVRYENNSGKVKLSPLLYNINDMKIENYIP